MNPPPESQYNQWACALACFVWCMKRRGVANLVQEDFVRTNKHRYWAWHSNNQEGLLSRGELFDLMLAAIPQIRKHVHTNSVADFHDYLNRNYKGGYIAGFVLTRKRTNHCLAIVEWNGQAVDVMNPDGAGTSATVQWTDLESNSDADFLAFFE